MFIHIKKYIQKAWLPTLVATCIFFVMYFFFGMENTMIGPFATLSFLRYRSMCNRYQLMIKNLIYYMIIAILACLAGMHLALCIGINILVLLWIGGILIDEYNPTNYFPMGMALIFFQIAPNKDIHSLVMRLAALVVSFIIITVFVLIADHHGDRMGVIKALIEEGFEVADQLIHQADQDETQLHQLHDRICEINSKLSHEIYAYNRAAIKPREAINWYCKFIIVFQIINYMTRPGATMEERARASRGYTYYKRLFQEEKPEHGLHILRFRVRALDIRNMRLRFALRQAIVVAACLIFAYISKLPNIYWLPISVFFMMIPYSDQTVTRVRQRVFGTIGGICACMILFTLFPGFPARVIIMTLANFMIYGANSYGTTVVYITCSALSLQSIGANVFVVLGQRLLYTVIGAMIALLANKLIFPIRAQKQISYLESLLDQMRQELFALYKDTQVSRLHRQKLTDQYIVKSYLITERIKTLSQYGKAQVDIEAIRRKHISEMADFMASQMIRF